MEIIGFRYSATGVFGYDFYQDNSRICTVDSLVVPSPTVHIHGFGKDWKSPFDQDSTIYPGRIRYVYRTDSDQEECHIIYNVERYDLQINSNVYCAFAGDGIYMFYAGQKRIAVIKRNSRRQAEKIPVPQDEPYYDREAYYHVDVLEEIPEDVLLLVLAFPMVRFGG